MKRIILICLFGLISLIGSAVCGFTTQKTVSISFSVEDFSLIRNADGYLSIDTDKYPASYSPDTLAPALPWVEVRVLIPIDSKTVGVEVNPIFRILSKNETLLSISEVFIPSETPQVPPSTSYTGGLYPENSVIPCGDFYPGGYKISSFLVCPFQFDSNEGILYFSDNIEVSIDLESTEEAVESNVISTAFRPIIKSMISNPDELDNWDGISKMKEASSIEKEDKLDYLIITNNNLADSFEKLTQWKTLKGLSCQIKTVESICGDDPAKNKLDSLFGKPIAWKIKTYLKEQYEKYNLKYVLLGGDDVVIPAVGCYGETSSSNKDNTIPCDLYYACFNGTFNWNMNRNSILGEISDNVDISPQIYVSRLPVRTPQEVEGYINNLITYEASPTAGLENKEILMIGAIVNSALYVKNEDGRFMNDSECHGDLIYKQYIEPHWSGKQFKFYESYSDFVKQGIDIYAEGPNVQYGLEKGSPFINVICHGFPDQWNFNTDGYYIHNASEMKGTNWSIITTAACHTNAFDSRKIPGRMIYTSEPCLSEAFIRNPNSKVLAYFGCSRKGVGSSEINRLGASHKLTGEFYRKLFSSNQRSMTLGEVTTAAKMCFLGSTSVLGAHRWLHFGVNPIGDPELNIFKEIPTPIRNFSIIYKDGNLDVNLPEDSEFNISLTGKYGNKLIDPTVHKSTGSITFREISKDPMLLCIYKKDHAPILCGLENGTLYLQNMRLDSECLFEADRIIVGAEVTDLSPSGEFITSGGNISLTAKKVEIKSGAKISANTNFRTITK